MTFLSVNINKIATIRNARGGNIPDVVKFALDCESFGADGITVHPRPDQRHIKYQDVIDLKKVLKKPFNIEGYPSDEFIALVLEVCPEQVTLVPDPPEAITSNAGWDFVKNYAFLETSITKLRKSGAKISLFAEPLAETIGMAAKLGANRVELYTEAYAKADLSQREEVIHHYQAAAETARKEGLQVNAGHDLNLNNLGFFSRSIPFLYEVSIGHALICDALYLGIENTINMYKNKLV